MDQIDALMFSVELAFMEKIGCSNKAIQRRIKEKFDYEREQIEHACKIYKLLKNPGKIKFEFNCPAGDGV